MMSKSGKLRSLVRELRSKYSSDTAATQPLILCSLARTWHLKQTCMGLFHVAVWLVNCPSSKSPGRTLFPPSCAKVHSSFGKHRSRRLTWPMTPAMKLGPGSELHTLVYLSHCFWDFACWSERLNVRNYTLQHSRKERTVEFSKVPIFEISPKLFWGLWKLAEERMKKATFTFIPQFPWGCTLVFLFGRSPFKCFSTRQSLLRCSKALATENKVRTVGGFSGESQKPCWFWPLLTNLNLCKQTTTSHISWFSWLPWLLYGKA